ncbi:hypothetical protein [Kribbella deserti]|uniref:MFS transporter n=1 Tax=Kribbella deserti TaxID=1926257 RepID=A0ABV6QQ27_9ACTN
MTSPLRSTAAVVAGIAVIGILSNGVDTVLEQSGVFPSIAEQREQGFRTPWMVALALAYRLLFAYVGGWLTARFAPANPAKHVVVLIVIGTTLGALGAIASWDVAPAWFTVLMLLGTPVAAWLGGMRVRRSREVRVPAVALGR